MIIKIAPKEVRESPEDRIYKFQNLLVSIKGEYFCLQRIRKNKISSHNLCCQLAKIIFFEIDWSSDFWFSMTNRFFYLLVEILNFRFSLLFIIFSSIIIRKWIQIWHRAEGSLKVSLEIQKLGNFENFFELKLTKKIQCIVIKLASKNEIKRVQIWVI